MESTTNPVREFSSFVQYMPKVIATKISSRRELLDHNEIKELLTDIFIEGCLLVLALWNIPDDIQLGLPLEVY